MPRSPSVDALTDRYRDGEGFQPFSAITPDDLTALQSALAGLTEVLSQLAGTLGLTGLNPPRARSRDPRASAASLA